MRRFSVLAVPLSIFCFLFSLFAFLTSLTAASGWARGLQSLLPKHAASSARTIDLQPVRLLTDDKRYEDAEPAPSPDGKHVIFSRVEADGKGRRRLWIIPAGGGSPRPLTPPDFDWDCTRPSWSRDGQWIAFRASGAVNDSESGGIWIMPASGGAPRQLTGRSPAEDDYYPQWFPDGRQLAVLRDVPGTESDVWVVALDGTARRLTTHPAFDGKSTISPDGRRIAFPSERSGARNLWIMPVAEGESAARQFTFDGGRGPAWSPDGRWIAYGCPVRPRGYALCLKRIEGGPVIQVTDGSGNDFNPEWGPHGTWIAVAQADDDAFGRIAIVDVGDIVAPSKAGSGRITQYMVPMPEEGPQLVLSFATYLGGSGRDDCDAVAVDHSGDIYLACHSNSNEFPLATSTPEMDRESRRKSSTSWEQRYDAFVVKLDPTGSRVLYTTSLGGSRWEGAMAITVDASGNVYVAGATESTDFPTTRGALQTSFGGGSYDAFVAKLDASGAVVYCTYLGGSGEDSESDIVADEAGNVYVVGTTWSKDFPTTKGVFQRTLTGKQDAFVAKLDATGSALLYSTYLGGQEDEEGWGIALDGEGNIYVTGNTRSEDFFTTPGAIQGSLAGGADVFVSKLGPGGSSLLYSTYLGGAGEEYMADDGGNMAMDAQGHLYVAGTTESHNFPTTPKAVQRNFAGGKADGFLAKLDLANSRLVYSTYLGGGGRDHATGVAVDGHGQAHMTVQTDSADFPTQAPVQAVFAGGEYDAFIVKFDQHGSRLRFATFLGGTGAEFPEDISLDSAGNVYISGSTTSTDFPTAVAIQAAHAGGGNDIILARFDQRSGLTDSPSLGAGVKLAGVITEYVVPTPESLPHDPAVDTQDRVWYTGQRANLIGMFDPKTEKFTEFPVPTADSGPHGLVSDAQGNIWFTENYVGQIGRLDQRTGKIREFRAPTAKDPHTPVFGPDGRLWFTSQRSNLVVRFNVKNFGMKEYPVPTPDARPYGIIAGPGGKLWFCELAGGKLASIEPNTGTITEFSTPTPDSGPRRLAADDRFVWVTEFRAGKLARFDSRESAWKEFPSPSGPESRPYGIALAADGSVWYNEAGADKMVRFDPATETFETFPMPSPQSVVRHMTRDSRGTLWLAVSGPRGTDNNQIARID